MVLNRLDDGLLVTLLTKKSGCSATTFSDRQALEIQIPYLQKSAIKSVTKVLNNWFVRIDYAS